MHALDFFGLPSQAEVQGGRGWGALASGEADTPCAYQGWANAANGHPRQYLRGSLRFLLRAKTTFAQG